ncbi:MULTISPECIES: hypothetical protein [unclassified Bradyrhizobium]
MDRSLARARQASSEPLDQAAGIRPGPRIRGGDALTSIGPWKRCRLLQEIVSLSPLKRSDLLFVKTEIATLLRKIVVQHADAHGLVDGLIWPKTGFASIV